jgi:hypothetical protein
VGRHGRLDGRRLARLAFEGEQPVEMDMIFVGDEFWLRSGAIPLPRGKLDAREMAEAVGGETERRMDAALGDRELGVPIEYGVPVEAEPPPARRVIEESELG